MRIPIPVAILLALIVVSAIWWGNTRHIDFLVPPTPQRLAEVRSHVEASFPRPEVFEEIPTPPPAAPPEAIPAPPVEPPKPPLDLGDLVSPPRLQDYGERSPAGTASMIELANALEKNGQFQRALLAWERVIDLTKPDASQAATAVGAIRRLRPTLPDWNLKPATAIPVTLHAGTGKRLAKSLTPALEKAARELEKASAGIIKVSSKVTTGKTSAKGATPVALWFTGPSKKPLSTEVLSFTTDSPQALQDEVMLTVYQLIRTHLARTTAYTPPLPPATGEPIQDALHSHITRLSWREFAAGLNPPPEKSE